MPRVYRIRRRANERRPEYLPHPTPRYLPHSPQFYLRLFGVYKLLHKVNLQLTPQYGRLMTHYAHWGFGANAKRALNAMETVKGEGPTTAFRIYIKHLPMRRRITIKSAKPAPNYDVFRRQLQRILDKPRIVNGTRFVLKMIGYAKHPEGGRYIYLAGRAL